jgi:hypothetical protein
MPSRWRFSTRIFVVDDEGAVRRIPLAAYERLVRLDPETCFPEYAGRAIRFALGYAVIDPGVPGVTVDYDYVIVHFSGDGRLDRVALKRKKRLADQIVRASHEESFDRLADPFSEQYAAQFRWHPTEEIKAKVDALVRMSLTGGKRSGRSVAKMAAVLPFRPPPGLSS